MAEADPPQQATGTGPAVWLVAAGLLLGAFALYFQTRSFGFLSYDDDLYLTDNPRVLAGLSLSSVRWAFTTFSVSNYQPLLWLSYLADVTLFGPGPGPMHLENAALHGAVAALFFLFLWRTTRGTGGALVRSALAAGFFAVHPLRVQSVAWISERKDVLATLLGLCALHAWLGWAWRSSVWRYLLACGLLLASLLVKPTLVTFPAMLLLLDVWPLGRWRPLNGESVLPPPRLLLEKLPFVALSVAASLWTVAAQRATGSILFDRHPLLVRVENALTSSTDYLAKTLWPADLSHFYKYDESYLGLRALVALLVLAALTALTLLRRRQQPALLTGWLWYLGTLVPMIGLVQVGAQASADRYTYVPHLGLSFAVAFGLPALPTAPKARTAAWLGLTFLLAALSAQTVSHSRNWRDSVSLYAHAIEVDPENWQAVASLGGELVAGGHPAEALPVLREAIRLRPDLYQNHGALGLALERTGHPAEALAAFETAARLAPHRSQVFVDLGRLRLSGGDADGAAQAFRRALQLRPGDAAALDGLSKATSTASPR